MNIFIKMLESRMKELAESNEDYFDNEGNLNVDKLKQDAMDELTEDVFELIFDEISYHFYNEMESEFKERLTEAELFRKNPLAYLGMSEKDFL